MKFCNTISNKIREKTNFSKTIATNDERSDRLKRLLNICFCSLFLYSAKI